MIILLNGPLGIGKSTLGEALAESIEGCVFLNGAGLVAANPPPPDETAYLHTMITLLVAHHRWHGYRHFVVDHFWKDAAELDELRRRLLEVDSGADVRCFLLTLSLSENLRRIERRQGARALDEREFEQRTVVEERDGLARALEDSASRSTSRRRQRSSWRRSGSGWGFADGRRAVATAVVANPAWGA